MCGKGNDGETRTGTKKTKRKGENRKTRLKGDIIDTGRMEDRKRPESRRKRERVWWGAGEEEERKKKKRKKGWKLKSRENGVVPEAAACNTVPLRYGPGLPAAEHGARISRRGTRKSCRATTWPAAAPWSGDRFNSRWQVGKCVFSLLPSTLVRRRQTLILPGEAPLSRMI